jgi:hypothetical protein
MIWILGIVVGLWVAGQPGVPAAPWGQEVSFGSDWGVTLASEPEARVGESK